MSYQQYQPYPALAPYIDAYWTVTGDKAVTVTNRIMPDGCVDIIINKGDDFTTDNGHAVLKHAAAYLVGTMTHYKDTILRPGTNLLGIRFKPAAFAVFYSYVSLHEVTDLSVEFDKKLTPAFVLHDHDIINQLNRFFINRLSPPKHTLFPVIDIINSCKGRITVEALAKNNFTSVRQLERHFKRYIGTGPKEFISFIRYETALHHIRRHAATRSLQDIAFDTGYYDHAHLSNEIKRYTGLAPSQL